MYALFGSIVVLSVLLTLMVSRISFEKQIFTNDDLVLAVSDARMYSVIKLQNGLKAIIVYDPTTSSSAASLNVYYIYTTILHKNI